MSVVDALRKALIDEQKPDPNAPKEEGSVLEKLKRRLIETDDGKPQPSANPIVASPPQQQQPSAQTPAPSNPQTLTAPAQPAMPSWLQSPQPPPVQQTGGQQPGGGSSRPTTQGSTAQVTAGSPANLSRSGGASSPGATLTAGSSPATVNPPPEVPPAPEAPPAQSAPPPSPGPAPVKISFAAIYEEAGFSSVQCTAEKMLDFVGRLPPELSMDQKQVTVMGWLETMGRDLGATSETIVADARGKVAILISHVDKLSTQTRQIVSDTSAEIAALQLQIEEKRKAIEDAQRKEAETVQACQVEANRLQSILKFFGADTTPLNSP